MKAVKQKQRFWKMSGIALAVGLASLTGCEQTYQGNTAMSPSADPDPSTRVPGGTEASGAQAATGNGAAAALPAPSASAPPSGTSVAPPAGTGTTPETPVTGASNAPRGMVGTPAGMGMPGNGATTNGTPTNATPDGKAPANPLPANGAEPNPAGGPTSGAAIDINGGTTPPSGGMGAADKAGAGAIMGRPGPAIGSGGATSGAALPPAGAANDSGSNGRTGVGGR